MQNGGHLQGIAPHRRLVFGIPERRSERFGLESEGSPVPVIGMDLWTDGPMPVGRREGGA
jgi:hypothetical protein